MAKLWSVAHSRRQGQARKRSLRWTGEPRFNLRRGRLRGRLLRKRGLFLRLIRWRLQRGPMSAFTAASACLGQRELRSGSAKGLFVKLLDQPLNDRRAIEKP